jgi:CheY-like chemotaxis protein/HPt (histidine-containing phosphotransfer) domain-containing protein
MSTDLAQIPTQEEIWLQAILASAAELAGITRRSGAADLLWGTDHDHSRQPEIAAFRHGVLNLLKRTGLILELSNIEAGAFKPETLKFDFRAVLNDILAGEAYAARTKQLKLTANVAPSIASQLLGDPLHLRQLLGSLLEHAITVTTAAQIEVSVTLADCDHNRLIFHLTDNGNGFVGTSLELNSCRQLLKAMGSELVTPAHPGGGCSFSFDIVCASDAQPAVARQQVPQVAIETKKVETPEPPKAEPQSTAADIIHILIVEDSEDSRFLLQEFLKKGPYEITFAENGKIAVDAVTSRTFDLILMDIQMPVMDGLAATRLIRQLEQQQGRAKTPLLALTSNARKSDIELSLGAGCDAHVLKPISKMELLNTVRKYAPVQSAREAPPLIELNIPPGLEDAAKRYISSKIQDIPRFMRYLEAGEFEQLRILAHDIKGSGTSYGFPNLTWLASQVECAAKERNASDLSNRILELFRYTKDAAHMMST